MARVLNPKRRPLSVTNGAWKDSSGASLYKNTGAMLNFLGRLDYITPGSLATLKSAAARGDRVVAVSSTSQIKVCGCAWAFEGERGAQRWV
jgi:hypothetical protein